MKIKNLLLGFGGMAVALSMSVSSFAAGSNIGMYIAAEDINLLNDQEKAAATWFVNNYSEGVVITPSTLNLINHSELDAIWVNADRIGLTSLPVEFNNASMALAMFVKDGGNLLLTKHATLLVSTIGRVADNQKPNIISAADGGFGTDVWNVNAYIGSWQINVDNPDQDLTQVYDRRSHAIYAGLLEFQPYTEWNNCPHPAFPLEGTGNGSEMWREDHNCLWDLNPIEYSVDGKNTVEKYEAQNQCTILGTWGHVQDYAVAAVVEFLPNSSYAGKVLANGLAAYEWAPRFGGNAYHSNIEKLTKNSLDYLAPERTVNSVEAPVAAESAEAEYYTLQGVRVYNPENGLFIKVADGKATKVIIK